MCVSAIFHIVKLWKSLNDSASFQCCKLCKIWNFLTQLSFRIFSLGNLSPNFSSSISLYTQVLQPRFLVVSSVCLSLISYVLNISALMFLIEPCHQQRPYKPIVIRSTLVSSSVAFRRQHLRACPRTFSFERSAPDCALLWLMAVEAAFHLLWSSATCFARPLSSHRTTANAGCCDDAEACKCSKDSGKPLARDSWTCCWRGSSAMGREGIRCEVCSSPSHYDSCGFECCYSV